MPSSDDILNLLATISRDLVALAIEWHVVIAAAAIALIAGWRPSTRLAAIVLALPATSAASAAFAFGSPFNAVALAALAVVMVSVGATLARDGVAAGPRWSSSLGIALILYGCFYPHFVDGPWWRSLYAAPVGLVPCPTLAVIAGFVMAGGGFASRAIPAALAAWTAVYALFGMFWLGVYLDAGLAVAMVALAILAVHNARVSAKQRGQLGGRVHDMLGSGVAQHR